MTNKVYAGTTSIEEHIEQLDMPDWITHYERKLMYASNQTTEYSGPVDSPISPKRKQSFEVQRLKRESGLGDN